LSTPAEPLRRTWVLGDHSPWRALAHAAPAADADLTRGVLRSALEDFVVEEILGFVPDGGGEHVLLQISKCGLNTVDVARQLARIAQVPLRDVGYCGLKDRNAQAIQWFSVRAAANVQWARCESDELQVLSVQRHQRKLRRGSHRANRFKITVRHLDSKHGALEERLHWIKATGVPNYFGEQRFGRQAGNLTAADKLFARDLTVRDRHRRGLYLSAARSWLFNCVLSQRVGMENWNSLLEGDVAGLDGSNSIFPVQQLDAELARRAGEGDLHPTGPLWGRGELQTGGEPLAIERQAVADFVLWCKGLEELGMRQERRALRLRVPDLHWRISNTTLVLEFTLRRGGFATSVLRECVDYQTAEHA